MRKYIIALIDKEYGFPPVFYAQFDGCFGTTPKREQAFVCDESEVAFYLEKAQAMENKMMTDVFLPVEKARKAESWVVA